MELKTFQDACINGTDEATLDIIENICEKLTPNEVKILTEFIAESTLRYFAIECEEGN